MQTQDLVQTIVGQGLAGTCLAWEFLWRGVPFRIVDRGQGGSSRMAAGMVNPITGKNFQPSWRIADFHPAAMVFYRRVEEELGGILWHPMPILRLASSERDARKISAKLTLPEVAAWLADTNPPVRDGFIEVFAVQGGGWLDAAGFLEKSRAHFERLGLFDLGECAPGPGQINCGGAEALTTGKLGAHRCAKGEILTVKADWPETHMLIGAGGWMIPIGGGVFRIGSTYRWDDLDPTPTQGGLERITEIARRLGGGNYAVVAHTAGIRPIMRRSEPLIGKGRDGNWVFNGLGSKGTLYAPGMAAMLADWIVEGKQPHSDFILPGTPLKPAFPPLPTELLPLLLGNCIAHGDLVIDATAGNGFDTHFLAEAVGENGRVIAIDIQDKAVMATRSRMVEAGVSERVTVHHGSHEDIRTIAAGGVPTAILFNLGYLPGGDRGVITRNPVTLNAIRAAMEILRPGGSLAVTCYPGHPGGDAEAEAVEEFLASAPGFRTARYGFIGGEAPAPFLLLCAKHV